MEISIHNWMRAESIEQTIDRIARIGYHKIEIQGSPELYDTQKVRKLLNHAGIGCWGSVTLMLEKRNLLAKNKKQRATSVQYVKDVVRMVAELEGQMVSVVPSTVGKIVPEGRPEDEWQIAIEGMQEIYEYAESFKILIGIEPINRFETYFINRGEQALALAKETGPNCGVCLDTFHMNIEESNTFDAIKKIANRLVGFHVADNNRMAPGMGTFNWSKIIETLKEIKYDKVLSVEFCSPLDRTPANPFPNSLELSPQGLSSEQKKFLEDHGSSAVTEEFYEFLSQKSYYTLKPFIV